MATCPFCSEPLALLPRAADRSVLGACTACMNAAVLQCRDGVWTARVIEGMEDIRQTAAKDDIGVELLRVLPQAIERLPVLPEVAHRVLRMIRDPELTTQALVDVIDQDQVIALKVLKLANNVLYGGLAEIKDLKAACTRLGFRAIANTVQAIANGHLYVARNPARRTMMENLWRHALASAHCANEIAALASQPGADVMFVAGLIHDVGKVLLLDVVDIQDLPAFSRLRQEPPLFEHTMAAYHSLVGLHIAQRWRLPSDFAVAAFCHDRVERVPDISWLGLVHTVALASAVANVSGFGAPQGSAAPSGPLPSEVSLVKHPSAQYLGLNDIKLATLRIDLEDALQPLFEITAHAV